MTTMSDRHLHRGKNGFRWTHEHLLGNEDHSHPRPGVIQQAQRPPEKMFCDFCYHPEPRWVFPCRDFIQPPIMPGLPDQGSRSGWASCDRCKALIETGQYAELLRHTMYWFGKRWAQTDDRKLTIEQEAAILAEIGAIQQRFAMNRIGPPEELT